MSSFITRWISRRYSSAACDEVRDGARSRCPPGPSTARASAASARRRRPADTRGSAVVDGRTAGRSAVEHLVAVLLAFLQRDAGEGDRQRVHRGSVVAVATTRCAALLQPPLHLGLIGEIRLDRRLELDRRRRRMQPAARSEAARGATRLLANQNASSTTSARRDDAPAPTRQATSR